MEFRSFITPSMGENIYALIEGEKLSLIDPGGNLDEISSFIEENEYDLEYIFLTHGHGDHIEAVNPLKKKFGGLIIAHKEEEGLLLDPQKNLSALMGNSIVIKADKFVEEGDEIIFEGNKIHFIHTPGHTAGSMCILVGDRMYSGDMLFEGAVGRTDLPTASPKAMERSIHRLREIRKDYKVFPGHGDETTLFKEQRTNPYF